MLEAFGTRVVKEGVVFLEHGPISMVLEAAQGEEAATGIAMRGAERVIVFFEQLTTALETAKRQLCFQAPELNDSHPLALQRMIASVRKLEEPEFTPMAAVAGTLADIAVESMIAAGADYALANNGGDIAFFLPLSKSELNVGIISDISRGQVTHRLKIRRDSGIRGLATSGFGGRSLTRGIASAVTVMAQDASLADAAATSVANACDAEDPQVSKCLAEEVDYDTDIKGLTVTRSIGPLEETTVRTALRRGSERASDLCESGMIEGAVLFVSGRMISRWRGISPPFSIQALFPKR